MKLESISLSITISYTDPAGQLHEMTIPLSANELDTGKPVFSSDFSSLPSSCFSTDFVLQYNTAMRELSGHFPTFSFLSI